MVPFSKNAKTLSFIFFLVSGLFFYGAADTQADLRVLSNSRHAYGSINTTINLLLGTGHVGTDILVDSTNMASGYVGCCTSAFNTTATYYTDTGAATTSRAPYQIYTSSFAVTAGDTVTQYNQYNGIDFTHNLAFTNSTNVTPPVFLTAPGGSSWTSKPGIEWTIDPALFCVSSLSCLTASNAGIMTSLRYNHPTWNWLDVKAALRQTGTNWETGYDSTDYGFGQVNFASSTALTDSEIALQPPVSGTSTNSLGQIKFTLYPFKQTRRVKEVLFQFDSNPGFQADELSLSDITTLGGTKITERTDTTATDSLIPIYTALSNDYFVWFTADDTDDNAANFSRIDTYSILGPLSQSEISYTTGFDLSTPLDDDITSPLPTFTWAAPVSYLGISKYQLYIDDVLHTDNITATTTTLTVPLADGLHTWYVKAINGGDTATSSQSIRTIEVLSDYTDSQTWYVDNLLGDDNNPGTASSPWATLTKATDTAQPGNTVVVIKNEGMPYRETIQPRAGDSSDGNITFRGVDSNNKPEIWGSEDVSESTAGGWTVYGGGNPNTYQRTTASVGTIAVGESLSTLEARVWVDASPTILNEGEWTIVGSTIYYRLVTGEDINTLHIEAGQRSYGLRCTSKNTFKNFIVRFASYANVGLAAGCIGDSLELYDAGEHGAVLSGTGSVSSPGAILRYSKIYGSYYYGIYISNSSFAQVYNNTVSNNYVGLYVYAYPHNTAIQNNIFAYDTSEVTFSYFGVINNLVASNNNWLDGEIDSHWTDTYKGTDNLEETDPLFIDSESDNFRLNSNSSNIDAGYDVSLTTDILGNHIYGTPDIGAYEYQPPFRISANEVQTTGSVRIYADGKYRTLLASTSEATAPLSVAPATGWPSSDRSEYMNLSISSWTSETMSWTASSTSAEDANFTISGLDPSKEYIISVDDVTGNHLTGVCSSGTCVPNRDGELTFTYSGTWSTHTFTVTKGESVSSGSTSTRAPAKSTEVPDTTTPSITNSDNNPDQRTTNSFAVSLELGTTHPDVVRLQQFLNTSGFLVTMSGPGSLGNETDYFGNMTRNALVRFQEAHRDTILTPLGLMTATGYFGPATMRVVNGLLGTNVNTDISNEGSSVVQDGQTFNTPLETEISHPDVVRLQQFLNTSGFLIAASGPGSPGNETDYFGSMTKAALIRFQETHRDTILTPLGLTNATGYFGPATMRVVNESL